MAWCCYMKGLSRPMALKRSHKDGKVSSCVATICKQDLNGDKHEGMKGKQIQEFAEQTNTQLVYRLYRKTVV